MNYELDYCLKNFYSRYENVLLSDYTSCLTYLMRYPAKSDVNLILQHALHMYLPKKFERPTNAFIYFTAQPSSSTQKRDISKSAQNNLKRQEIENKAQRVRSTSLNGSSGSQIEQHISVLQAFNAADAANQERLNQQVDSDQSIIDGYSSNSPELLRLELKNAQTVVSIARSKLQAYLSVIKRHANNSKTKSEDLSHAIDGIEELCSLLDIKYMFPLHARRAPIEQAFEANEMKGRLTPERAKLSREVQPQQKVSERNSQSASTGSDSSSADKRQTDGYAAYERPDDCINTNRLLGSMREIELLPIISDEKVVATPSFNSDS